MLEAVWSATVFVQCAQIIARIRYILEETEAPAAVRPAVDVLHLCVCSSREAAAAVVREPGLVACLLSVLDLLGPGRGDPSCEARLAAQGPVLELFKAICHWDRTFTHALLRQGIAKSAFNSISKMARRVCYHLCSCIPL